MKSFPSISQIENFARRAIGQLPDSLAARKSDLAVLAAILPKTSDGRKTSLAMWHALDQAEQAQAEFCFPSTNFKHDGDGHNGKDGQ